MEFLKSFFTNTLNVLLLSVIVLISPQLYGEELSDVDSEALEKTVELLNNRDQRNKVIDSDPQAKKTNEMTKKLFGNGAELDAAYQAASEILRKLAADSQGNPQKMLDQISNAQQNPEEFYKSLDPAQKQMIENLSKGIEQKNSKAKP